MMNLKYRKPEEMKDSGVEWVEKVPVGWKTVRMKHLSTIVTGTTPPRSNPKNYENGHMPWIKPDNIQDDFTISESQEKLTLIGLRQARVVPIGSAIVCCIGTIGKVAFADQDLTTNQQINSVIFDKHEQWLGRYGTYSLIASGEEHKRMSNRVVVSILNKSQQGHIKMPLPDILSQTKIADFLDVKTSRFDSIISKKEKLIEKLEEAKKSLISEVVTGKVKIVDGQMVERSPEEMKDSGVEWLGIIPRGWQTIRLKHMVTLRNKKGEHVPGQQYVGLENIESWTGRLIEPSSDIIMDGQCTLFKKRDVLFCKLRPYLAKCIVAESDGCCTSELLVLESKTLDPQLLKFIMLSVDFIEQVNSSTYGSKMPRANWEFIGSLEIPLFDKLEQTEMLLLLTSKLGHVDRLIARILEQINLLKEAKQSLIYEAVTGKIDLRDWEIKQEGE